MANFIRGTDSEKLRKAADSFAAANGGVDSSVFGSTQAHHLFSIEVFGDANTLLVCAALGSKISDEALSCARWFYLVRPRIHDADYIIKGRQLSQ